VVMPYSSMKYLDQTQLLRYKLTDPCTVTCNTGYTGDFCQDQTPLFNNLPMGPWNQAGYYTVGSGLLRTQSISVASIDYIQYTRLDSTLIGILNAVYASSRVVEIALYSRTIRTVMTPPSGGSFDSLVVRGGVPYLARTTQLSSTGRDVYEVVALSSTYTTQSMASPADRVGLLEVFIDKGTVTTFVYLATLKTINACYPDGTCPAWATLNNVNGLACGADCHNVLYVSAEAKIFRVTSATGSTLLSNTGSTIYCLTGMSSLNVLLYKSPTTMYQLNLATQTSSSIPLGIADAGLKRICSLDVSELNNQILIVQDGVIRTLEAVQLICGYGLTSQALLGNSSSACTPCAAPPARAYWIEGSATCEWTCLTGYTRTGSMCVPQVVLPCPAFYVADTSNAGLCIPSLLPWADQGKYVSSMQYSQQLTLQGSSSPYPTVAVSPTVLIEVSVGTFYVSRNSGSTWTGISVAAFSDPVCAMSALNRYYYLGSKGDGMMYIAFYYNTPAQHCLWYVNAASVVAAQSTQLLVVKAWALRGKLCSATGDESYAYLLLCGTNFLSYSKVTGGTGILPLAGNTRAGHADSSLRASLFRAPSSMVLYDSRLYVTDSGNCVIRELDLLRDTVTTVAGTTGLCQITDDGTQKAALANPMNLTYTPYAGFFLFVDKNLNEAIASMRQFHVPTCTVQTVRALPSNYYNEILAVGGGGIMIRMEKNYYLFTATGTTCPDGTSSLQGSALAVSECTSCGVGFYSDALAGSCRNCSTPSCTLPGQLLVPCQMAKDAFCGLCTNKPAGNTQYTGPSSILGNATGGGDCPWTYTPPCPIGYYASNGLCASCPVWSTTASSGRTSVSSCVCLGNGYWKDGVCIIPAIFGATTLLGFPLLPSCSDYTVDSPSGVCPCQPGEYIQQINPKLCTACQNGYYSPDGTQCLQCPFGTEPSMDKTTCRCAGGLRDASAVTDSMPQCVCGPGHAYSSDPLCTACEANTYSSSVIAASSNIILSRCLWCESGTFSGSGASGCEQCPFGTFRLSNSPLGCQNCPAGRYATDTRYDSCTNCVETCSGGLKETACPTDPMLVICSECQAASVRANAYLNGGRNCATTCQNGYFERDEECVPCMVYNEGTCGNGSLHVPCGSYADAACMPCENASMPLNYAVWGYSPEVIGGPNARCEWTCEAGYEARRMPVEGVQAVWECVLAGAWSVWDLFTI
jgi:hypothetical protein